MLRYDCYTRIFDVVFLQREGDPYCHRPCYASLFGPGGKLTKQGFQLSISLYTAAVVKTQYYHL